MTVVKVWWVSYTKPEWAWAGWLSKAQKQNTPAVSTTKDISITSQQNALSWLSKATGGQVSTYTQKMKDAWYNTWFLSQLKNPATWTKQKTWLDSFSGWDPYYSDNKIKNTPTIDYWDLWNKNKSIYNWKWVQISSGNIMKDASLFSWTEKNSNYDLFWSKAQEAEKLNPWFIQKRNDVYAMDIAKVIPNLTQENADKSILEYLKAKDVNWTLWTWENWNLDVQNTLLSIKNRIWTLPTEEELRVKQLTWRATDAYNRKEANIESQYAAEKNTFLKQWAVEDRFTNFNEVNDKINNILTVAWQHRAENWYVWTPDDAQIWEIATKAWQDFATTKKILEWRGFEDLKLQDEFAKKSSEWYDRQLQDQETSRNRAIQDADTQHWRTLTALNEQIDDVKKNMEDTLSVWEKAWALSWWIRSSGYVQWLESIRNKAIENMNRLKTRAERDSEDTALNKSRINETYWINTTRIKTDLENSLNQIKTQNGSALSTYLAEYAPSSSELTRKLDELDNKFGLESQEAFNNYLKNLQWITDTMTYDTEKALKLDQLKQNLQQTNITNLMANNGAALAWISYSDLSTMLQKWDISPTDYTSMTWYMKTLWLSSLQSLGTPTQDDISLYNSLLSQNVSPQQALATVVAKNPSRFQWTKWGSDWKYDENTGKYMRTNAQWNIEFTNDPTSNVTPSNVPNTYTAANENQQIEGDVFLSKYKEWDKAPRDGYCWQFINDYLKDMWITNQNLFIDPILEKTKYVNSQTPKKWSIMIMDSKAKPENGHVAVVESVNSDWTVNLKEANRNWDWKVHTRKNVNVNNIWVKVYGYFDPTLSPTSVASSGSSPEKDTYLALVKKWGLTKNDQENIAKKAIKQWWSDEFNEALNQWAIVDLSPAQTTQYNKEYDRFLWNQVVKWFEEWLTQFESLWYSLSDKSGPGDMAWVFSFMKTLDPSSVVRETEFNEAAKSAWVFERAKNIYANLTEWKILTSDQAETFKKIASKFISSKWESYDRLYSNMKNAYKQFGIPDSLLPIKATEQLNEFIKKWSWSSGVSSPENGNIQKVQGGRWL